MCLPERWTHSITQARIVEEPLPIKGSIGVSNCGWHGRTNWQFSDGSESLLGHFHARIATCDSAGTRLTKRRSSIARRKRQQRIPPLPENVDSLCNRPSSLQLRPGVLPRKDIGDEWPGEVISYPHWQEWLLPAFKALYPGQV